MSPTKALIFDFDGLVVDTETPLYDSWRVLYQEHGHDLDLATYVECVGSTTHRFDPITHLESLVGRPVAADQLHTEHRSRVERALATRDTLPGVRERLTEARAAGLGLAIASSSPSDWIDPWLAPLGLTEYFNVVRTRDHVSAAKPSPELFVTAVDRLGIAPHEALVFEDSYNGLQAALAAAIPCVAVPNAITEQSDFARATLVLSSLAQYPLGEILTRAHEAHRK